MNNVNFRCWNVEEKIMHTTAFPSWNGLIEVWADNEPQTTVQYLSNGPAEEGILMQFTGLTDRNGKDIYEGDVILWATESGGVWDTPSKSIVKFEKGCFVATLALREMAHIEVIGNKFEHPNLITH